MKLRSGDVTGMARGGGWEANRLLTIKLSGVPVVKLALDNIALMQTTVWQRAVQ